MAIKFGSVDFDKGYFGSTEVDKLYLGSNLLWQNVVPLTAPTISLAANSSTLTITTNDSHATSYKLWDGTTLFATVAKTTDVSTVVDLSTYTWTGGAHTITVSSISSDAHYIESEKSTSVSYTPFLSAPTNVSLTGTTITLDPVTNADSYGVYDGDTIIDTYVTYVYEQTGSQVTLTNAPYTQSGSEVTIE